MFPCNHLRKYQETFGFLIFPKIDQNQNWYGTNDPPPLISIALEYPKPRNIQSWRVSIYAVFLVRVFLHSDLVQRCTEYIFVFRQNAKKCGPNKLRILKFFNELLVRYGLGKQKFFVGVLYPAGRELLKVNNRTTRTRWDPVDTGYKLNVHKTFKGRLLNVLCTFNLRSVSTGDICSSLTIKTQERRPALFWCRFC